MRSRSSNPVGVLCDWQIKVLCEAGMITPFNPTLLNPASLDVLLGDNIFEEQEKRGLVEKSIAHHTKDNPYLLHPNEFILAQTIEKFNVPNRICAQFALKSSVARAGIEHLLAGWIDPGFNDSVLTLELKNARRLEAVKLWPGMRIGQIVFYEMSAHPLKSYRETGRYNGDDKVAACKGLL